MSDFVAGSIGIMSPRYLFGLLLLTGCSHSAVPLGPISPAALQAAAPTFARAEPVEATEQAALAAALAQQGPIELEIYFGDWCSDSQRELPKLLALVQALPAASIRLELINLDHDKRDPEGRAAAAGIQRIPTVIVRRNGEELGRLIERPQRSIGQDMARWLNQADRP